jgi:hypothetical protein
VVLESQGKKYREKIIPAKTVQDDEKTEDDFF